jgi:hypothetical protein
LPDGTQRTNTATATLQNYAYDYEGKGTPSGTSAYAGSANVDFSKAAVNKIDECIDVSDSWYGSLGKVCAGVNTLPKTFTYNLTVGPYAECGSYKFDNTAFFVTNDTGFYGTDTWTVTVSVPCAGCTLTPGYWKTHSYHGPAAKPDDAWYNLGDVDGDGVSEGPDEMFFLSGQTYYEVLWTSPKGGNAYYILAHAYIAARLNLLDGASSTPAVNESTTWAENFFKVKTPADVLDKKERAKAIHYAEILDQYNNGYIGPGHCTE